MSKLEREAVRERYFCRNELMSGCESNRVDFVFGLARNKKLRGIIRLQMHQATVQWEQAGKPARVFYRIPKRLYLHEQPIAGIDEATCNARLSNSQYGITKNIRTPPHIPKCFMNAGTVMTDRGIIRKPDKKI